MIQVKRGLEPDGFEQKAQEWWAEFQAERVLNPALTPDTFWAKLRRRSDMQRFADHLARSFYDKCVYCESQMKHVSPGHIDHYHPKTAIAFQSRMLAWDNWLLACSTCNTNKGSRFVFHDGCLVLLDPSAEDPAEHISFLNAQILYCSERGRKTIELIKLDRLDLDQKRMYWLNYISCLLLVLLRESEVRDQARKLLIWSMQDDAPYAGMIRVFLREKTPNLAIPITPHPMVGVDERIEAMRSLEALVSRYQESLQDLK